MITLLMATYAGDRAVELDSALMSVAQQTRLPNELVLVKDGPIPEELDAVIEQYTKVLPIRMVALSKNGGLANALNFGINIASNPWIMRFDADDICHPERIERQISFIEKNREVQLFGAQIEEFETTWEAPVRTRLVPCLQDDIRRTSLIRNPFNHMTVCFLKAVVDKVGGYPSVPFMEDYALWCMLLKRGVVCSNMPEVVVWARVGNGMLDRRGGWNYLKCEWNFQRYLVGEGVRGYPLAICAGALRSAMFASPRSVRGALYNSILRQKIDGF